MKKKYIGKSAPLNLINGKIYDVLSVEKDWYRIVDETNVDYLYPPMFFVNPDEDGYVDVDVCEYIESLMKNFEMEKIIQGLKEEYVKGPSESRLKSLVNQLRVATIYMIYNWELNEDEEKLIENTEIGDDVHIESPMQPVVWEDEETGELIIPIFSSEKEIPEEYYKENVIPNVELHVVVLLVKAFEKVLKRPVVIELDSFSEEPICISVDLIEKCINE